MKQIKRDKSASSTPKIQAFLIKLGNKVIDTVFYSASSKVDVYEVKKSLVEHDGYDSEITVYKRSY